MLSDAGITVVSLHVIKAYARNRSTGLYVLDIGARRRRVVSLGRFAHGTGGWVVTLGRFTHGTGGWVVSLGRFNNGTGG